MTTIALPHALLCCIALTCSISSCKEASSGIISIAWVESEVTIPAKESYYSTCSTLLISNTSSIEVPLAVGDTSYKSRGPLYLLDPKRKAAKERIRFVDGRNETTMQALSCINVDGFNTLMIPPETTVKIIMNNDIFIPHVGLSNDNLFDSITLILKRSSYEYINPFSNKNLYSNNIAVDIHKSNSYIVIRQSNIE